MVPALGRILAALCIRKLPALALRRRGWTFAAGKHPSSWIPISKVSPVLLDGVLSNGLPLGSSGGAEKDAALNKQVTRAI